MVAIIITSILFVLIIVAIIAASGDKTVDVEPNSILQISFNVPVTERTPDDPLVKLGISDPKAIGLNEVLADIAKAKTDKHIKGIFLDESAFTPAQATSEEIRNALIDFKTSGKFVIAYSEIYEQSFYYLASVADKVYINPKGIFLFHGFSEQITFLKGALDKLGIEAQIIKVGTYKSAVEPFFLTKMSAANKLQVTSYLGSMYDHFLSGIGESRHISKDSLFEIADNLKIRFPEDALKYHLVDGMKYKDEVLDELKQRTGVDYKRDIKTVNLIDYAKAIPETDKKDKKESKNQVAIIYASGDIIGGDGDDNSIGSERVSKALRDARLNDNIKAVVFRVNLRAAVRWPRM